MPLVDSIMLLLVEFGPRLCRFSGIGATGKMKQCPACKRELSNDLTRCPHDGAMLGSERAPDPLEGKLLDEKYLLEKKVGEGGMGAVYKAMHVEMDREVAVKVLRPDLASDQTAVQRFRREARAAARIRHPNLVAVTDFGFTEDRTAYLVMEFLEGSDLTGRIKKQGQLGYEETCLILSQTCAAVQAAHDKGIIHRDLKPDNIWLENPPPGAANTSSSGEPISTVKVLDFGIAKLKTPDGVDLTQKGFLVGTPYYMSPEQCKGEELDPRSDIYSLGIILYQMLSGRVPFEGEVALAIVVKHISEQAPPLRKLRPDVPDAVARVVMRAIAKKKEDRQDNATQLAQEFQAALHSAGMLKLVSTGTGQPIGSYSAAAPMPPTHSAQDSSRVSGGESRGRATVMAIDGNPTVPMAGPDGPKPAVERPILPSVPEGPVTALDDDRAAFALPDREAPIRRARRTPYIAAAAAVVVVLASSIAAILNLRGKSDVPPATVAPPGMVLVQAGNFNMGTNSPSAPPEQKPAHGTEVSPFYMDVYEVTNQDYSRFVRETHHAPPSDWPNGSYDPQKAKLPVVYVSWIDATAYAEWAGKRLPTEAEWEYAARGHDGRIYPWGNDWSANYSNSAEDDKKQPVAVGSYPSGVSWCGVYDLAGNVSEWVADEYKPYPTSTAKPDPGFKVYRGGAYSIHKDQLVCTYRFWDLPNRTEKFLGFRCAKNAK
jgi:serine/threonine protein kinase